MANVRVEAQVAPEDLLKAIEQLESAELEEFVARAIALRARRRAPTLPADEAELLAQVNQGLPAEVQSRYDDLLNKRRAERLSPSEHDELLRLTDQVEGRAAERVQQLARLAQLRGVPLSRLLDDLGEHPPAEPEGAGT
jgi:hypothetical protein